MEVIVKGQSSVEIGFETKVVDSYKSLDSALSETSKNPVTNAAITAEIRRQDSAIEQMSESNEQFKSEVSESISSIDRRVGALEEIHETLDVVVADMVEKKVDAWDYAPDLTAGFADNLVSGDVVVESEFNVRQSGGGAIADGVARMDEVRGNGVVWNQLIKNGKFADLSYWSNGISSMVTTVEDGVATMTFEGTTSNRYNQDIRQSVAIYANHKYFFAVDVYSDDVNECHIILYTATGSRTVIHTMQLGQWNHASGITTMVAAASGSSLFRLGTLEKIGQVTMKFKNVSFYDLTLMFGAGNEPTTVDEFYKRIPQNVNLGAYNAGEIIPMNIDAVKSVGRNVWDEQWEIGTIATTDGTLVSSTSMIRSANFIKVLPSAEYRYSFLGNVNHTRYIYLYDESYQYISYRSSSTAELNFTTPPNCAYIKFVEQSTTTYNNDICINLSDPDFNGQYEPYKEDVRELPAVLKEVFPDGMRSAGNVHDMVYNKNGKGVIEKRIGVVDLGSLSWYKSSTVNGVGRFAVSLEGAAIASADNVLPNMLCERYVTTTPRNVFLEKVGISNNVGSGQVTVFDSSYTDTASFKAAMSGVMLYYELATPEIIEYDEPFNLDYEVTNGGQEIAVANNSSAPFAADIKYGFNAAAKIKENANEIASLKATIAQLQEAMASMVDNNVEE